MELFLIVYARLASPNRSSLNSYQR